MNVIFRKRKRYVVGELVLVFALAFGAQLLAQITMRDRIPEAALPYLAGVVLLLLVPHVLRTTVIGVADDNGIQVRCRPFVLLGWLSRDRFLYFAWTEIKSIKVDKPENYSIKRIIESRSFEGNSTLFIEAKAPRGTFYCRDFFKAADQDVFLEKIYQHLPPGEAKGEKMTWGGQEGEGRTT